LFLPLTTTGDEPLFTQEVHGCPADPRFAAHARHTLLLQPGEALADCFSGGGGGGTSSSSVAVAEQPGSSSGAAAAAAGEALLFEVGR
jgi:hypothetical protein